MLFGKYEKNKKPIVSYPDILSKINVGDFTVMVTKVDEKKGLVHVSWLDDNGNSLRAQEMSVHEYNALKGDGTTTAAETNAEEKTPDIEPEVEPVQTKENEGVSEKNHAVEKKSVYPKEISRFAFHSKPNEKALIIVKGKEFKTVDRDLKDVTITINKINKQKNGSIQLDVTIADKKTSTQESLSPASLQSRLNKSAENAKKRKTLEADNVLLVDNSGNVKLIPKSKKEGDPASEENINLEKSLVYKERVTNAINSQDEEYMTLLLQVLFFAREKYSREKYTEKLVDELDRLYRNLDDARNDILDKASTESHLTSENTPLGFSIGETISIFGTSYRVVAYDADKKRYTLYNTSTHKDEIKNELEIKFSWSYPTGDPAAPVSPLVEPVSLTIDEEPETPQLGQTPLGFSTGDTISLYDESYEVVNYFPESKKYTLADQDGKTHLVDEKSIADIWKPVPTKEELEKKTALATLAEQIRITIASINMLEESLAHDDEEIKKIKEQIAALELEEKNSEGKKIFEEIVEQAKKTRSVLGSGIEGNEFYYDSKDNRGFTLRNYYRFDGVFAGTKIISDPEETRSVEKENNPGEFSRLRAIVRFQIDNPREVTTTRSEDFLKQYPHYVAQILASEKLVEGYPDNVKFALRKIFDEGHTIQSVEDNGSEYAISYISDSEDTEIYFVEKSRGPDEKNEEIYIGLDEIKEKINSLIEGFLPSIKEARVTLKDVYLVKNGKDAIDVSINLNAKKSLFGIGVKIQTNIKNNNDMIMFSPFDVDAGIFTKIIQEAINEKSASLDASMLEQIQKEFTNGREIERINIVDGKLVIETK